MIATSRHSAAVRRDGTPTSASSATTMLRSGGEKNQTATPSRASSTRYGSARATSQLSQANPPIAWAAATGEVPPGSSADATIDLLEYLVYEPA